ncbi:hypothetical protein ACHQM5_021325 [Ranunculus cassubicifolius]
MRDWSKLPGKFLSAVCDRLDLSGLFAFNRVCSSWRYSSSLTLKHHLGFLFIVQKDFSHKGSVWVFSPLQFKFYSMKLPSGIKSGNICGFSDGWLALEDDHLNLQMLPVCSSVDPVHLPPLPPSDLIDKTDETSYKTVCMSADQSVFMAIDRCLYKPGGLYIYRPKHHVEWILIRIDPYDDLIYFKGLFYAVSGDGRDGRFTVVDPFLHSSSTSNLWTIQIIDTDKPCARGHLVEISGQLRVVCMGLACFFVKKLENGDLVDTVGELGDHALLLNRHHSCLVPLSEFPRFKAHHVYAAPDPYTKFKGNVGYYGGGIPFAFMGDLEYSLACQYEEAIECRHWLSS